jgi:hypothetical protein
MVIPTHRVVPPSPAISPGNNLADTPTGVSPQQFLIQSSSSKLIIAWAFPILASLLGCRVKSAYSKWPSLYFPWSTHDPWRQGHYVVSKFCRTKQWVYQTRDKRPNPRKATLEHRHDCVRHMGRDSPELSCAEREHPSKADASLQGPATLCRVSTVKETCYSFLYPTDL